MVRFLPFIFAALVLACIFGFDFAGARKLALEKMLAQGEAHPAFGFADYASGLSERLKSYKSATKRESIFTHLPAPEGWQRRTITEADLISLFGPPKPEAELTEVERELLESWTFRLVSKAADSSKDLDTLVYEKGDALVAITAKFRSARELNSFIGGNISTFSAVQDALDNSQPFALVYGLEVQSLPQRAGAPARKFTAALGKQIRISIDARAGAADLRELLESFDVAAMNAMLETPVPGVGAEAVPFALLRAPEPSAEEEFAAVVPFEVPDVAASVWSKIGTMLSIPGANAATPGVKPQVTFNCSTQNGFKRCAMPK